MKNVIFAIAVFVCSLALFAEPVEVRVVAQGNGKVKVGDSAFESEIILSCEPGTSIVVQIPSMDNFIGWGGWGKCADRSLELTKTIEVGAAPMTITAYFTSSIKDNLILNGDFSQITTASSELTDAEKSLQSKDGQKFVVESFDRLTAGEWYIVYQHNYDNNKYTRTGLLIKKPDWYSNLPRFDDNTLTLAIGGKYGSVASYNSKVKCLINVPCGGEYKLTFDYATGHHSYYMYNNKWDGLIYLKDGKGNSCYKKTINYTSYGSTSPKYKSLSLEGIILPRGGIYELYFEIDRPSITEGSSTLKCAHVAYDNLSFNLVRARGFSVAVR